MRVMIDKKLLLSMFAVFSIVIFLGIVFAATAITNPVASGNYTTTMNFTVTTAVSKPLNMTIYYNSSGGKAGTDGVLLQTMVNTTGSQTVFTNASVDVSSLADLATYNFSAYVDNGTDQELSVSIGNVTIDNTPPNVLAANISSPVNGAYYSSSDGSIDLNVSVSDATMNVSSVYFNITNSTGGQLGNVLYTSNTLGALWNTTINLSALTGSSYDDTYNCTVFANDTLGNLNNSASVSIIFDNTNPVVAITSTTTATTSLTLAIGVTDIGTTSCTVDRSGASVSETVLTESGLSCGTSYAYVVTCTDAAGNSGSSSSTSFTTSSCGDDTSSGGWSSSQSVSDSSVLEGTTRLLRAGQKVDFTFSNVAHHMGVKSVSENVVTLEIASLPIQHDFSVGDEFKFDLDDDSVYDLYVKLEKIDGTVASVYMKIIEESDSFDDVSGVDKAADITSDGTTEEEDTNSVGDVISDVVEGGKAYWLWIVLGVIVVAAVSFLIKMGANKSKVDKSVKKKK